MKVNGAKLARDWGLNVAQARYSAWGNWYAPLTRYPAALLDAHGYVLFPNESTLQTHDKIKVTKQINVPSLISTLPEYIQVTGLIPEELPLSEQVSEGTRVQVVVNRYERSTTARKICLEHYGYSCEVCGLTMKNMYGDRAAGLIHVHHLVPVSEIGSQYMLDPIADLRPVCPNCHAFLHTSTPPITISEAKEFR